MASTIQLTTLLILYTWGQCATGQRVTVPVCGGDSSGANVELALLRQRVADLQAAQAQIQAGQIQLQVRQTMLEGQVRQGESGGCPWPQPGPTQETPPVASEPSPTQETPPVASEPSPTQETPTVASEPTCDWEMVFRVLSNVSQDSFPVWDAATTPSNMPEDPRLAGNGHYRSRDMDVWDTLNIKEVKVSLYTFGQQDETRELVFNGVGSDKNNWFSKDRLISSPWSDLKTEYSNYFSIAGILSPRPPHHLINRRFNINHRYGGCPNDYGWLVVLDDNSNFCEWERRVASSNPNILYSKRSTHLNYYRDWADVGIADAMAIFIKTCED